MRETKLSFLQIFSNSEKRIRSIQSRSSREVDRLNDDLDTVK